MREDFQVLRRAGYRRLWLAGLISQLGDWLSYVAVSLLAIEHGSGAVDVALVLVLHTVPRAVLAPISGALADRADRRKVMLWAAAGAFLVTALMAWAASARWLGTVQVLLLLRAAIEGLAEPSRTAAVSQLVPRRELVAGHALMATTWSVMFTLGMAAGGLLAMLGPELAIGIDALTFVAAGAVVLGLPALPPVRSESDGKAESVRVMTAISTAWRASGQVAGLRQAALAKAPLAIAGGGTWLLLNISASRALGVASTAMALGVLHAVRGIGTGIGPIVARRWMAGRGDTAASRLAGLRGSHVAAMAGYALFILVDADPLLALASMLLWGGGAGANWVVSTARVQELAPPSVVGRVVALDELAMITGMCGAVLAAGWMVDLGVALQTTGWVWLGAGGLASLWLLLNRGRTVQIKTAEYATAVQSPGLE